jgi:hypothetical protein
MANKATLATLAPARRSKALVANAESALADTLNAFLAELEGSMHTGIVLWKSCFATMVLLTCGLRVAQLHACLSNFENVSCQSP